jgi:hypothetical protein
MQPSLVLWAAAESRVPPKPSTSGSAPGGAPHKPYTVPPGYKAPTLGEQFRYVSCARGTVLRGHYCCFLSQPATAAALPARLPPTSHMLHPAALPHTLKAPWCVPLLQAALRHPYSRYGYVAAVAMGLLGWAVASGEKKPGRQLDGGGTVESSSSKS